MMNPFAEVAEYYIERWRLRSPVVVHKSDGEFTIGVRSPRGPARNPKPSGFRDTSDVGAVRTVTFFGSWSELSISHRAPKAYFSDEIRLQRRSGTILKIPRWPEGASVFRAAPFRVIADTAARQAGCAAASIVKYALSDEMEARAREASCYTLASRRIHDGSSEQREFDPSAANGRAWSPIK